jgi:peptide/nickel transport system permease protein
VLRLIVRRILLSVPLLLIVPTWTFLLVALIPGNIARTILGQYATQQQYLQLKHALGLDQPLYTRYWEWLERALHGNLGISLYSQEPVTSLLNSRLGVTLWLVIGSTLIAAVIGLGLGVAGALFGRMAGRLVDAISLTGLAIPNFFLGLLLVTWFSVALRLFPASGYVNPTTSLVDWLRSMVLPLVTLAAPGVAIIAKQTRDSMRDAMERPFIHTLRACGLPRRSIIFKHALRSGAIPVITVIGLVFIGALSGTVIVESVFALPGLGGLAVQATEEHDVPLIQGVVIYFTVIVIAVNLLIDIAYGWLDPRVRLS